MYINRQQSHTPRSLFAPKVVNVLSIQAQFSHTYMLLTGQMYSPSCLKLYLNTYLQVKSHTDHEPSISTEQILYTADILPSSDKT